MKRNIFDDEREKKLHKVDKGTNKFNKHKNSIYNMLVDEDYEQEQHEVKLKQSFKNSYTKHR